MDDADRDQRAAELQPVAAIPAQRRGEVQLGVLQRLAWLDGLGVADGGSSRADVQTQASSSVDMIFIVCEWYTRSWLAR